MKTHVIILAQGQQTRLRELPMAKQMLPLPACGGTPILHRTVRQVERLGGVTSIITVVCPLAMAEILTRFGVEIGTDRYFPAVQTLRDPGNSSLKGISRVLALPPSALPVGGPWDRTIVLLGDVIYSWACLRAIFAPFDGPTPIQTGDANRAGPAFGGPFRFVGTGDISPSGGELWGVSWPAAGGKAMRWALDKALEKHPPFDDTYQCGQLRRWMWAFRPDLHRCSPYVAIDDYTRDVDLPDHVTKVPAWSVQAAADDAKEGITW